MTKDIAAVVLVSANAIFGVAAVWATATCASFRTIRIAASVGLEGILVLAGAAGFWGMALDRGATVPAMIGVLIAFMVGHVVALMFTASREDAPLCAIGTRERSRRLGRAERKALRKARRRAELDRRIAEMEREAGIIPWSDKR